MKGVVLAGGTGSRLFPLTKITNKHLLPIYNKPMIYYPIEKLVEAGIKEIMIITGGEHAGDFLKLLENGSSFGLKTLRYAYQEGDRSGIAHALSYAQDFVGGDRVCVILGDNIFQDSISDGVKRFLTQESGARIFLKQVEDAQRFGVAQLNGEKVVSIEEKPKIPKSNYAVTGVYMYDGNVFNHIKKLKPSGRGELEITDVNNFYIKEGTMQYDVLNGWWTDAGTFDSLLKANNLVSQRNTRQ